MDSVETPSVTPSAVKKKEIFGWCCFDFLQRLRLDKARRMLGTTADSLQTIADWLGFNSPFHLSAAFKKEFGVSPQKWRRAMPRCGVFSRLACLLCYRSTDL